jgi:hypothetical protein
MFSINIYQYYINIKLFFEKYFKKYYILNSPENIIQINNKNDLLLIDDFIEHKIIEQNKNIKNGYILLSYYDKNYNLIGYIKYNLGIGQIYKIYVDDNYQNKDIENQMLKKVILDMKINGVYKIWSISTYNDELWSNIYNKKFLFNDSIHISVSNKSGYYLNI